MSYTFWCSYWGKVIYVCALALILLVITHSTAHAQSPGEQGTIYWTCTSVPQVAQVMSQIEADFSNILQILEEMFNKDKSCGVMITPSGNYPMGMLVEDMADGVAHGKPYDIWSVFIPGIGIPMYTAIGTPTGI